MKYKLINSVSKIETICDKVTMDGFDYYVSDERAVANDFALYGGHITKKIVDTEWTTGDKKVIATNNPNIDIPKVVDEVEILLENYYSHEDDGGDRVFYSTQVREIINKSQETHPFSEEDMIDFYKWVNQPHPEDNRQPSAVYIKNIDMWWHNHKKYTSKELLQLWKEQQPKIVYYNG